MIIKTLTDHLVDKVDFASYQECVNKIHLDIINKTGAGNDFLGWVDYPETYNKEELAEIKNGPNTSVITTMSSSCAVSAVHILAHALRSKPSTEPS